jgi:hypothetical protein
MKRLTGQKVERLGICVNVKDLNNMFILTKHYGDYGLSGMVVDTRL